MINRANRFHGQASLRRMQTASSTVRGGSLSLKYAVNVRRQSYRLAVVVSKKVSKSAVIRNRIRRRLYESVRILSSNLIAPTDLVIVVYDEKIAVVPAESFTLEVTKLFEKAKLIPATATVHGIVETQRKT